MKYIEWLLKKRFPLVLAIVAAFAFPAGMITAAVTCNDLDKQHQAAVAAGVFTVGEAEAAEFEQPEECRTYAAPVPEECRTYFDVPLSEDLQNHIFQLCEENGIDPAIIVAMCFRESAFDASAIGDNGQAFGMMQIQPKWHSKRMDKLGCTDLLDPFQNVTVGVDYLCELLNRYDGDMAKALTAYNRGHYSGTVTQYAKDVMEKAKGLVMSK